MYQKLTLKSGNVIELNKDVLKVNEVNTFKILNNLNELQVFLKTCNALKDNEMYLQIKMSKHKLFFELQGHHVVECYYSES